jgi:hypothetical protein
MKFKNFDFLRCFCIVPVQNFRSHIRPLRPGLGLTMTFVIFHSYILFSYASNQGLFFFPLYVFSEPEVHFRHFLLCCTSQRSARSQVPSQVATHQETGSQLWAVEAPDSNPGLQDNSLAHYH